MSAAERRFTRGAPSGRNYFRDPSNLEQQSGGET